MGEGLAGFGRALDELRPDMLVLLGDRWEALAAACAATVCRVPVAHLHGGELTRGAMDESFRHAITKMAHLHFTACEQYRRRVIQLGEAPGSVHNVGAIGLENIRSMAFLEREELSRDLGLDLSGPFVLATFHPTTLDPGSARAQAAEFFAALDAFPALPVVLTRAGADTEARAVNELAGDWASGRPGRARFVASLGQLRYLSAMRHCAVVAGNSSSGIIEAPSLGVPTVNVGERQDGRVRAASVIDCPPEREAITAALGRALSPDFAALARRAENPCEETGTAAAIVREVVAYAGNVKKTFHDLSSED
jgi:UDP-hydrolysing UDP-N-acetyl-D-glucosamine 2-epimerase